ncbi:MAG: MJ1477/TM1410 family putative glycoside hydrolase [Hyphomicrobiaceae bacterium]
MAPSAAGDDRRALLGRATSWGYQLQNLNVKEAAAAPFDILVVDYSKDGDDESALTPAELARLKRRPDGRRRLVFAYLSIGEAESYRSYWNKSWKNNPPRWLLGENPDWEENYAVAFWDEGWQSVLCGSPQALLDKIQAQGFDGVYLDKCDVTEDLKEHEKKVAATRRVLDGDMVELVSKLVSHAHSSDPQFLFIIQNAEFLLERPILRSLIDGVGKEELFYGMDGGEKTNSREDVDWSCKRLDLAKQDGKAILVVEYLDDRNKAARAREAASRCGYTLYVSSRDRELDHLKAPDLYA